MSSSDLKIHLEPPYNRSRFRAHTYGPGDKIAGKVFFSPKSDEDVESIYIDFKGKVKANHGHGKEEKHYEYYMFTLTEKLFKGPYKMRAGVHEWPFEFVFPEKFKYMGNEFRDEGMWRGFADTGMMKCPPSAQDNVAGDFSGGGYNGGMEIHYHLTARIPRTFMDWEDKIYLQFSPWRTEVDVAEERRTAKTNQYDEKHTHFRVSHDGVPRALTKTEAFREALHHKAETKTVTYGLEASAPTQIVIGKSYQVELALFSKGAEELGVLPEFKIKSYELLLKDLTYVRVPGAFMDHETSMDGHIPFSRNSKVDVVLPVNKAIKLNGMFPTRPPFPPPTFTSWCIKRTYGLELKVVTECLGEEERFKIHWMRVALLPARMEPGVEEAMRSIEDGTASLEVETTRIDVGLEERATEGLPAYEGAGMEEGLPRYEKHVDQNAVGL